MTTTTRTRASYRPDIDGLRAVAVLSVVAFHAFPSVLPGGFAGVDVFFVISGFLITGILVSRFDRGHFTYAEFYERRIRRIFPALWIVLAAVYVLGRYALVADERMMLGRHIASGAGFIANFAFWSEAGYFDKAAQTKPLLHLWSLGIEEQFYIVWPLLLFLMYRYRLRPRLTIAAIAGVSFAINCAGTLRDPTAAYYSPIARAWELMLGAGLVFAARGGIPPALRPRSWHAFLGVGLFGVGLVVLNGDGQLPVGWAMLPTIGTCLVIWSGPEAWLNRNVLSTRPLVAVGLISYPLYLWHWPLLSFAFILRDGHVPASLRSVLVVVAVGLAASTYLLVERPVRVAGRSRVLAAALSALMLVVGAAGYRSMIHGGQPAHVEPVLQSAADGGIHGWAVSGCGLGPDDAAHIAACVHDRRGEARYALLGDSKAAALFPGLLRQSTPDGRWLFIGGTNARGAAVPVLGTAPLYAKYQPVAIASARAIVTDSVLRAVVIDASIRALFQANLTDSLEGLPSSPNAPMVLDGLDRMVTRLAAAGKKVVLFVDNPTLPDPKNCVARTTDIRALNALLDLGDQPPCEVRYDRELEWSRQYRVVLNAIEERHPADVRLFDSLPLLCNREADECRSIENGRLLYSYADHISDYAAGLIARSLIPEVDSFVRGADDGPAELPLDFSAPAPRPVVLDAGALHRS